MGLRFRKSVKLGPGVRLNLSRKSASVSLGGKAGRYTISTTGRRTSSINLPGGFSYVANHSPKTAPRPAPAPAPAAQSGAGSLPKPGLFASAAEKQYHTGVHAYMSGDMARALDAFQAVSIKDECNISDDLFAGLAAAALNRRDEAISYLERVIASDIELPDTLQRKYLPSERARVTVRVGITERVWAEVGFDSVGAALMLAELYQAANRREDAIGLLQQLAGEAGDELAFKLSLCDLLFDDEDYEGVVEVASPMVNVSDVTMACLHLKAMALAMLGMRTAALDAFAACLKRTAGRDAELVREIRYDRAVYLETIGESRRARTDWEKLYANDPKYRDVAERLRVKPSA